jgi:hypothetical protein
LTRIFDPATETQKLRDHLASHDKPIAFLFGAGTSAAVVGKDGKPLVPAVAELTQHCAEVVQAIGAPFSDAWSLIVQALDAEHRTIEDILSSIRQMRAAILPGDTLAGLGDADLQTLEEAVQKAISQEARPAEDRFPDRLPQRALGRWIRRIDRSCAVEIFTTNYDTLLERALEDEWVPVFDGFIGARRPFFSPASLAREAMAPGRRWTRLWKLHGSVTWALDDRGTLGKRIVRGEEQESGELILPSLLKYDESRKQPYVAMTDRLRRVLADREDAILVTAGYSFGDQHINEVIFEALDANPRLHVFALCFEDPAGALAEAATRRTNILALGPNKAIVGGQEGTWALHDPSTFAGRLAGIFVPTGNPSETTQPGELRLGDFNVFCALLDLVAGSDD